MDYEKDLIQCTASELFPSAIFWIKQDNGEFHMASVDLAWYPTSDMLKEYRTQIKKWSQQGRLYTRRDKAFKHF